MMVQCRFAAIRGIQPHEWIVRFVFGGVVCVLAGVIAKRFGPEAGGLFLAFPAIFPAGASLVETHERKHKARAGFDGSRRGRTVAAVDAAGAAIGCIGLAGFAVVCWLVLPRMGAVAVFVLATAVWLVVSILMWWLRKTRILRLSHRRAGRAFHAS
ncbi:MAG TPA: DUF3147 family protein [Terracidiphilus sp.]|jgi:hypothetical protein